MIPSRTKTKKWGIPVGKVPIAFQCAVQGSHNGLLIGTSSGITFLLTSQNARLSAEANDHGIRRRTVLDPCSSSTQRGMPARIRFSIRQEHWACLNTSTELFSGLDLVTQYLQAQTALLSGRRCLFCAKPS